MAWSDLIFTSSHVLTASDMNGLQANFAAMAGGNAGAPPIAVNSLVATGVASLQTVAAVTITVSGSGVEYQANKGQANGYPELDSSTLIPEAQVPFEAPGPIGSTTADTGELTNVELTGAAPSPPAANTIYKDNVAKAWINFDGTGTIAIRDSFNVSSITDNGVGDYTVVWDTDFADAKYAVAFGVSGENTNGNRGANGCNVKPATLPTAGAVEFDVYYGSTAASNGAHMNASYVMVQAFGAQ